MRGDDAGECAGSRGHASEQRAEQQLVMRGVPKWLRKAKNSPAEGDLRAEEETREKQPQPRKFQRKSDFENSYLFFQEESGKMITRGVVAMDLSFKLI